MMTHAAYHDDSGSHEQSPLFIVAGYLGSVEEWAALTEEWKIELRKWGLTWFHMVDAEGGSGELRGWPLSKRHECIAAFANIIGQHDLHSLATRLDHQTYRSTVLSQAVDDRVAARVADTFSVVTFGAIIALKRMCDEVGIRMEDVSIVFAKQSKGGRALENYGRKLAEISAQPPKFMAMRDTPALQAADMRAWFVNRISLTHVVGKNPTIETRHERLWKRGVKLDITPDEIYVLARRMSLMIDVPPGQRRLDSNQG